jgi:hypothetical protein
VPCNQLLGLIFHHRVRQCAVSTPFYLHKTQLCYDVCPDYQYTNTTYNYCIDCHYACQKCSQPNSSLSCSFCEPNTKRFLNGTSCDCRIGTFEAGARQCGICHFSCVSCFNSSYDSCLSCDTASNFILNSTDSSCLCKNGYYENGNHTCIVCSIGCLICSYINQI